MTDLKTEKARAAAADHRIAWRERRIAMEEDGRRFTRSGPASTFTLKQVLRTVEYAVGAIGLRRQALQNVRALDLTEIELFFPDLPAAFDGYTVLHLSDLHVGRVPGMLARAAGLVRGRPVDLAVITGDFQSRARPSSDVAAAMLKPLVRAINAADGIVAVLGNHDRHDLVEPLEAAGIRCLLNQHLLLMREGGQLLVTGLDDVNCFYTGQAAQALRARPAEIFGLALVHSPEMADLAASAGYGLYLSGHTHGGQICLPGGRPLVTALDRHRDLASGVWQLGGMLGYTSRGVGVITRARFNCPPEIVLLRLRRNTA